MPESTKSMKKKSGGSQNKSHGASRLSRGMGASRRTAPEKPGKVGNKGLFGSCFSGNSKDKKDRKTPNRNASNPKASTAKTTSTTSSFPTTTSTEDRLPSPGDKNASPMEKKLHARKDRLHPTLSNSQVLYNFISAQDSRKRGSASAVAKKVPSKTAETPEKNTDEDRKSRKRSKKKRKRTRRKLIKLVKRIVKDKKFTEDLVNKLREDDKLPRKIHKSLNKYINAKNEEDLDAMMSPSSPLPKRGLRNKQTETSRVSAPKKPTGSRDSGRSDRMKRSNVKKIRKTYYFKLTDSQSSHESDEQSPTQTEESSEKPNFCHKTKGSGPPDTKRASSRSRNENRDPARNSRLVEDPTSVQETVKPTVAPPRDPEAGPKSASRQSKNSKRSSKQRESVKRNEAGRRDKTSKKLIRKSGSAKSAKRDSKLEKLKGSAVYDERYGRSDTKSVRSKSSKENRRVTHEPPPTTRAPPSRSKTSSSNARTRADTASEVTRRDFVVSSATEESFRMSEVMVQNPADPFQESAADNIGSVQSADENFSFENPTSCSVVGREPPEFVPREKEGTAKLHDKLENHGSSPTKRRRPNGAPQISPRSTR